MIMMGIHFMGEVPFKKVYLHAMVRDEKGEKMSKSKGNVIDPLVLINEHGADPLRFTLTAMAGQGRDIKLSVDRVEGYRAFANKIWNATKFFHLQFEEPQGGPIAEPTGGTASWLREHRGDLSPANRWILSRLQHCTSTVEKGFVQFELNESANALYEFVWRELCDWYIEFSKIPLRQGGAAREQTLITLAHVLEQTFRLMHPIMPFVTEELWQSLPWKKPANTAARIRDGKPAVMTLMFQSFPKVQDSWIDIQAEAEIRQMQNIVEAIRNFRGENNISPKVEFPVRYTTSSAAVPGFLADHLGEILALCRIQSLEAGSGSSEAQEFQAVIPLSEPQLEFRISLAGLVNVDEEVKRVKKEMERVGADLEFVRAKLSKESFTAKAPPALVEKERAREKELADKLAELSAGLGKLQKLSGVQS